MIKINSQELRDAVQAAYEFDKEHGKWVACHPTTDKYWSEVYEFDGKTKTYYFDNNELFAYGDVV